MDNLIALILLLFVIAIIIFIFILIINKNINYIIFGKEITLTFVEKKTKENNANKLIDITQLKKSDQKNEKLIIVYFNIIKEISTNPTKIYVPNKKNSLVVIYKDYVLDNSITIDPSKNTNYIIEIPNEEQKQEPKQEQTQEQKKEQEQRK